MASYGYPPTVSPGNLLYQNTGTTATNTLTYGGSLGTPGVVQTQTPSYRDMARNVLSDHCALMVYEKRLILKEVGEKMPGDFDLNRKLLCDLFLMSPCHMTLEQAGSLAFCLKEDGHTFIKLCDEAGAIIPSGE